nr:G patch domain-containing protein TGH [Tanacetum cinerariifolium]
MKENTSYEIVPQKEEEQEGLRVGNKENASFTQKMTAESHGNIIGQKHLQRTVKDLKTDVPAATEVVNLQFHLSDTIWNIYHLVVTLDVVVSWWIGVDRAGGEGGVPAVGGRSLDGCLAGNDGGAGNDI